MSSGRSKVDWRFQRLDDGAGLLEFNTMSDARACREFLRATFQSIHDQPITGLVVDLRANTGGKMNLGYDLLSYITDKPLMLMQRMDWKVSARYKRHLRQQIPAWARWMPRWMLSGTDRPYLDAPVGSMLTTRHVAFQPQPNPLRTSSPVCFLIGSATYSSAVMLASAVGDYQLATLIGEETGGWPNTFGAAYSFPLPVTGLIAHASTARFVRPSGDASIKGGVLPDITVDASRHDGPDGDPAMARAREWIRARGAPVIH
jgi:C-terminal processing protease CtpA/Prc